MLLGSNTLEVAIGLFFIYLLLSLLTSAINEWLAGFLALRANTLRRGIENLLDDPVITGLAKRFYQHPLVVKLGSPNGRPPSYIGARTFATVLLDLLPVHDDTQGAQTSLETFQKLRRALADLKDQQSPLGHILLRLVDRVGVTPEQIATAHALLVQLQAARTTLAATDPNAIDAEGYKLLFLRVRNLEAAYQNLEREVGDALDQAQQSIETYFDQAMERLTGVYRRRTQWFMIGIAMAITLLLNVDTFALVANLSGNDELRRAVADQAATYVANQRAAPITTSQLAGQALGVTQLVTGTATVTATLGGVALAVPQDTKQALELLTALNLPLGWSQPWPEQWEWLTKVLGLLVSAAAAAMGAPFWFDLLSRATNVRLAGRPPSSSVPTSPPAEPA